MKKVTRETPEVSHIALNVDGLRNLFPTTSVAHQSPRQRGAKAKNNDGLVVSALCSHLSRSPDPRIRGGKA
ncbi:hypothetical protein [Acidithrix ferrooxidans]|uniref:hypothetical protein n=1 Tax=Acidithrix ferrooxidans TaxID=1280514 RepID=UPI00126A1ED7|nr:hypothetical protein [Acidithrix ferrooxidans]